jgi:hypothetical protein
MENSKHEGRVYVKSFRTCGSTFGSPVPSHSATENH